MYYFAEAACVLAELRMFHLLLNSRYPARPRPLWFRFLCYFILGAGSLFFSLWEGAVFLRLVFHLVGIYLLASFLFYASPMQSALSSLLVCALFAVVDMLTAALMNCLGLDIEQLVSYGNFRIVYIITAHVIMLGLVLAVCFFRHDTEGTIPREILIPVVPCWLVSILLCCMMAQQVLETGKDFHPLGLMVMLGMLYVNIVMIYYTNRVHRQEQEKQEMTLAEHHYAMQQEYYDQFRIQQEETRALWHDISKYIRASQTEGSENALTQVQEMLDSIPCVVDVNNRVVSVILNEYVHAARAAQVDLEMDVQIPEVLSVTAADLYVLIGNTMDNAIEACQSVPKEKRKITLKLKMHNSILFYEISNPFCEEHLHRVRSKYHGYGLKNVVRCVEKYDGNVETSKDSGIFRFQALLNSI